MPISSDNTGNAKNPVVLELFTSQGCSSCPPADRLLGKYASKKNIIALSFHVDYWDRLGWKDPFSSHRYSERQYRYASALKSGIFTPQLVIDGETQLVGSESTRIASAKSNLLVQETQAHLLLEKPEVKNDNINLLFHLSGNLSGSILHIAFIEKKAVTVVGSGENRDHTLSEYNVVRSFTEADTFKAGENKLSMNFPSSLQPGNRKIVLLLQQIKSLKITAAGQAEF